MDDSAPLNPCVEKTIALVFETFRDVTREGGVSWSETFVHDGGGDEDDCRRARQQDNESSWEELANDPDLELFPGTGGFCFLDPIGFRYYLPVAMVKKLRGEYGHTGEIDFHLDLPKMWLRNYTLKQWSNLQPAEIQSVCEFLKCMDIVETEQDSPYSVPGEARVTSWKNAYRSHWVKLDSNPLPK